MPCTWSDLKAMELTRGPVTLASDNCMAVRIKAFARRSLTVLGLGRRRRSLLHGSMFLGLVRVVLVVLAWLTRLAIRAGLRIRSWLIELRLVRSSKLDLFTLRRLLHCGAKQELDEVVEEREVKR